MKANINRLLKIHVMLSALAWGACGYLVASFFWYEEGDKITLQVSFILLVVFGITAFILRTIINIKVKSEKDLDQKSSISAKNQRQKDR